MPAASWDAASPSINGPEENPDYPCQSKRTRQSLTGVGCDFAGGLLFEESLDIESLRVARGLIEGTERQSTLSDRGDLYMLLTEEWLLTEAAYDEDVLSAVGGPEKVLEKLLADKFKARLRLLGVDSQWRFLLVTNVTVVVSHLHWSFLRTFCEIMTCGSCSADTCPLGLVHHISAIESDYWSA